MIRLSKSTLGALAVWLFVGGLAWAQAPTPPPPPGKLTTLFNFVYGSMTDGSTPEGGLVLGADGVLYGTTALGGASGNGTFFSVTSGGAFNTIYSFRPDAGTPRGNLVTDNKGFYYGTTSTGTVYRITAAGAFTTLGRVGVDPNGLLFASDGNIYGMTARGVFFRVTTSGVVTTVRTLSVTTPSALTEGSDGNFYGTGLASVFKLTPAGDLTTLVSVSPNSTVASAFDGLGAPASGLVQASDGDFYGISSGPGGVFRVSATGNLKRVIRFTDVGLTGSGGFPYHDNRTALILGGDGNLYGTVGESDNRCFGYCGSVYQISTSGQYQLIYRIPGSGLEGGVPSILTQGPDGLYGTTVNNGTGKPLGGGTVFKVVFDGGGGGSGAGNSGPPSNAGPGPISSIDPNTTDLLPIFLSDWSLSSYDAFATYPTPVTSLAADGVTPLVLRCPVPAPGGNVVFTLSDENGNPAAAAQIGSLGCVYSKSCAQAGPSYTVPAQLLSDGKTYMAFVRLTAPVDFARPGTNDRTLPARAITVTAKLDSVPAQSTLAVNLVRPPVVLLHGLWSDYDTWKWPLQQDSNFVVVAQNYKDTNSARFAVNLNQPRRGIQAALDALRFKGVAATQADFIGHSMGGILGRLYAGEFNEARYYRDDNLGAGDIHKLITLDTPHAGSELADLLVNDDGSSTIKGEAAVLAIQECIVCGAIFDLRTTSAILRNMPAAPPPAHAIVGVGGGAALDDLGGFGSVARDVGGPTARLALAAGAGADWLVGRIFSGRNDMIVSENSQRGGLTGDAVTVFEYDLPLGMALHTTVTIERRVSDEVVRLLDEPVGSTAFGHFQKTGAF